MKMVQFVILPELCDENHQVFGMMPHPERTNCMVIKQILEYYIKLRQTNNLEKLEKNLIMKLKI